jgi:cation/acetate symporter
VTTITSSGSSAIRGSMFWPGLTTRGALIGGFLGLISAVVMVVLSKAVWVQTFGFGQALFPYDNPGLFSMVIGFGGSGWSPCWTEARQLRRREQHTVRSM